MFGGKVKDMFMSRITQEGASLDTALQGLGGKREITPRRDQAAEFQAPVRIEIIDHPVVASRPHLSRHHLPAVGVEDDSLANSRMAREERRGGRPHEEIDGDVIAQTHEVARWRETARDVVEERRREDYVAQATKLDEEDAARQRRTRRHSRGKRLY